MAIYIVMLIIVTASAIYTSNMKGMLISNRNRKSLYFCLVAILILVQGLRANSVGGDLYDNYAALYQSMGQVYWGEIFSYSALRGYEIGYIILNKICYIISNGNLQFLLFTVALLYLGALAKFMTKLSNNRFVGLFIFFASYMYNISMNNIRSTVAIAIILFFIPSIMEKKYIRFMVGIVIASLFHKTAFVFFFFFATTLITNVYWLIFTYLVACVGLTVGYPLFIRIVGSYFPRYSIYFAGGSDGGYGFFAFMAFMVIIIAFMANKKFWEKQSNVLMFKMLLCGLLLQIVSLRIPFFVRAVYYHMISLPILIPALLVENRLEARSKSVLYFGIIICFWLYFCFFLKGNNTLTVPYKFCF